MITVRPLPATDVLRLYEVDRSEHITRQYVLVDGALQVREVDIRVGPWSRTPPPGAAEHPQVGEWRGWLARGGLLLGATHEPAAAGDPGGAQGRLAGFAVVLPELEPGLADLALLYVDAKQRGRGVGARLTEASLALARAAGATQIYVSATPTVPTVDFYRGRGFVLAPQPHPAMFAAEPEDIHMIRELPDC